MSAVNTALKPATSGFDASSAIVPPSDEKNARDSLPAKSSGAIKVLPIAFRHGGWNYRRIWRERDIAVYAYDSRGESYELIIVRVKNDEEIYPSAGGWGKYGWSFGPRDRDVALRIARTIVKLSREQRLATIHAMMDRWSKSKELASK